MTSPSGGIVVIDKPAGMTSHDVVARVRRLLGTRRVGHAGTLDPMATGVLVVGVEKATRLLGYLMLTTKTYQATIRLGARSSTDDAEGELSPAPSAAQVTDRDLDEAITRLTGDIQQVPPGVSAVKVNGQRAYKLTRAGAAPELAARPVTVYTFELTAVRRDGDLLDADAVISCSSGTYIRALARDLGAALGTGGYLTALRRTQVGPYTLAQAQDLASRPWLIPLEDVAAGAFPRRDLTPEEARKLSHGGQLSLRTPASPPGAPSPPGAGSSLDTDDSSASSSVTEAPSAPGESGTQVPVAAFAPDGTLVALIEENAGSARALAVFV